MAKRIRGAYRGHDDILLETAVEVDEGIDHALENVLMPMFGSSVEKPPRNVANTTGQSVKVMGSYTRQK